MSYYDITEIKLNTRSLSSDGVVTDICDDIGTVEVCAPYKSRADVDAILKAMRKALLANLKTLDKLWDKECDQHSADLDRCMDVDR